MQAPAPSDIAADPGLGPGLNTATANAPAAPVTPGTPAERAAEFVPVTGPAAEGVPGGVLMLLAYFAFWAVIFRFVWTNHRQTQKLQTRLAALETALADAEKRADDGDG